MRRTVAIAFTAACVVVVPAGVSAPAAIAAPLDRETLIAELRARAIVEHDFARTELWTWTSRAQADAIARGEPVLWAHAGDGALRAPYQQALDGSDHPLARWLSGRARRYAWTTPYGTAVALGARSYGPALVRIAIDEDAWHVRFAPGEDRPFVVVDARGAIVPIEAALAEPERIATVYHVRARSPTGPYREIVVVGHVREASIEGRARITEDRRVLAAMRRARRTRARGAEAWREPIGDDPATLFAQTMPFDTPRHRASSAALGGLLRALVER